MYFMQDDAGIVEASFLDVMDRFALDVFPTAGNMSTDNISEFTQLNSTTILKKSDPVS